MDKIKLFSIVIIFISLISCNPNDDNLSKVSPISDTNRNFGAPALKDFIGQVVDTNNQPIQSATVMIGTATVQTDVNGVFIFNKANVFEKFAYVRATKIGFIDGSRAMIPTNGKNNVKIMMIPAVPIATVASGSSSEVTLASGTKVVFDGAFETESGAVYTGNVDVSMYHLTTSNQKISELMPGMLYAQAVDGTSKALKTYGMLQVELRGAGGEKLQIAEAHTAQITMLIDPTQLAVAPSTTPLWHFDDANGYWKEEGSATRTGNKYVGIVSHFSWWNCDLPNASVNLTFNVFDNAGNPIPNLQLKVSNSSGSYSSGSTDNNGQLAGLIPANEVLTLNIYSQTQCSTLPINSMSIGPFSADTVLPNIGLNSGEILTTIVQGSLLKCDNTNVTDGYVLLKYGNQSRFVAVNDGLFSFDAVYCDATTSFSLTGVDY